MADYTIVKVGAEVDKALTVVLEKFYPDANQADQGVVVGNLSTIKDIVDYLNGDPGTIVLRHTGGASTVYTVTTSETIPATISLIVEKGATISGTGTLTVSMGQTVRTEDELRAANSLGWVATMGADIALTSNFTASVLVNTNGFKLSGAFTLDFTEKPILTPKCFATGLTVTGLNYVEPDYWDTTDTAASQAALDCLKASGGGEIHFPKTEYTITSTLTYDVSAIASQTEGRLLVSGIGAAGALMAHDISGPVFDYIANSSWVAGYIRFQDIRLEGNNSVGSIGIRVTGGTAFNYFEGVIIISFRYGVYISDIDQSTFTNCIIRFCYIGLAFYGAVVPIVGSNNLHFIGCTISNNSQGGIYIKEASQVVFLGGSIQFNALSNANGYGLYIDETKRPTGTGYGVSNLKGVVFEGNAGIADLVIKMTAATGELILNVDGCAFLRAAYYATNQIYESGGNTDSIYNISGCAFKYTTAYTPSAARPSLNFTTATQIYDNGTNFWQSSVEAPVKAGWTANRVSWTPQLWDATSSASEGQAYTADNYGRYFRMGNAVFITGRLALSSIGTLTGAEAAYIGNLPYQPVVPATINIGYASGLNLGGNYVVSGVVSGTEKKINLRLSDATTGGSNLSITEFGATGDISFSGWYFTDEVA